MPTLNPWDFGGGDSGGNSGGWSGGAGIGGSGTPPPPPKKQADEKKKKCLADIDSQETCVKNQTYVIEQTSVACKTGALLTEELNAPVGIFLDGAFKLTKNYFCIM